MLALKQATRTIPIVGMSSDPVAYGIVTSLPRPEANITGVVVDAGAELWGKRLRDGGRSSDIAKASTVT